jgi:hypothetical protein
MDNLVQEILKGYLTCALWTDEENLKESDENVWLSAENITDESIADAKDDIVRFLDLAGDSVKDLDSSGLGHDIWLTRNGHGAGFFDRGYDSHTTKRLMAAADALGVKDIYVGDDSRIYFS